MAKILLIDDYDSWGEYSKACLGKTHMLTVVHSLSAGIAAVKHEPWDAIILDLNLPPESYGMDTYIEMTKHSGLTPILIATGGDDSRDEGVLVAVQNKRDLQDPAAYRGAVHRLLAQRAAVEQAFPVETDGRG